jgi:CHAD domain-containing protein
LRPLKRLQDNLGLFNDYSVQQDSLHALLDELNKDISSAHLEIAQSVGALIVVLHRKQVEERDKVVESFAKFNDEKTNSTFRALFKNKKVKA